MNESESLMNPQAQSEITPQILLESFRQVVRTRRSIRVFDGTPIPPEVIQDCLDLAIRN